MCVRVVGCGFRFPPFTRNPDEPLIHSGDYGVCTTCRSKSWSYSTLRHMPCKDLLEHQRGVVGIHSIPLRSPTVHSPVHRYGCNLGYGRIEAKERNAAIDNAEIMIVESYHQSFRSAGASESQPSQPASHPAFWDLETISRVIRAHVSH